MNRFLLISMIALLRVVAFGQCTSSTVPEQDVILQDTNQHSSGGHSASTGVFDIANPTPPSPNSANIHATCNYTAPSSGTTCNTSCGISFGTGGSTSERGTLNASGTHQVFTNSASGQGSASAGGTSCTGAYGGGTANCGLFGCSGVGLSVSVGAGGATATLTGLGSATAVWSAATPVTLTCAARSTQTTTGGGGVPPNPCLNGATVQGPSGSFTSGGGGGGPTPVCSPILIDSAGEGFHLTSAAEGVSFDITGTGHPVQIAWTSAGSRNAFLALPGSDGLVHNGKQLFGNFTAQPQSPNPNGFLALDQYDLPQNGGNGDGILDDNDAIFSHLRLWIDANHDGVSQAEELHTLAELGVHALALSYFESRRTDDFGNQFRYRARVNPGSRREPQDETSSGDPGRWAYDVFFVVE